MIADWWQANRFEVYLWLGVLAAIHVLWLLSALGDLIEHRRRLKKNGLL